VVSKRIIAVAGTAVGVATAGLAVAGVVQSHRRNVEAGRADRRSLSDWYAELAPSRVRTVAADDGVPLSVEELDPPDGVRAELTVVYVHGFALDRRTWVFQRHSLASLGNPPVRQVAYDQRGHGRSGRPGEKSCTIDQLGRDLDTVLDAVVPTGPLLLVGHSMGGMAIMALAEQRPELFADRVRGVALISTSAGEVGRNGLPKPLLSKYNPMTRTVGEIANWQPGLVEWVRSVGFGLTRPTVRRLAFGDEDVPSEMVDLMMEMLAVTPVSVLTAFVPTLGTHNRYGALAGLRHCEVLVVSGDRDRLTPFSHAERIATELPHTSLVLASGAGHMVMLEQHERVSDELISLLARTNAPKTTGRSLRNLWRNR
jgi:pimeloyl-ACP methyl ester carboxylesterase